MNLLILLAAAITGMTTITPAQTETATYYDYLVIEMDGVDYLLDDCANSPYLDEEGIPLFENGQEVEVVYITSETGEKVILSVDRINRKGTLLITRQTGTVVDDDKNGETKGGDYISYKRVKDAKKGDKIVTVFVWNPDNNYHDDINIRYDYIKVTN